MSKVSKKFGRLTVLMFLVVSLSIPPVAVGADEGRISVLTKAQAALRTKITRVWVGESIDKVLMDLAEQADVDIVKSPKVTGMVDAKVTGVPLAEVLTNILAAHDYTYVATDDMIRVVPVSEITLAKDALVSKVYRITYADVSEVAESLEKFVDKGGVAFNKGTSHIVVTDTQRQIKAVDRFIAELDRQTQQVLVEVRIYDITTTEGFELGTDWHAGRNAPYTADVTTLPTQVTKTEYDRIDEWQDRTDDRTMDGRFLFPTDYRDWYMEDRDEHTWTEPTTRTETTYLNPPPIVTNRRRKPFVGGSFDRVRGGTLSFSLLNDAVDIDLVLNMLKSQVESKLLANPRVLVLDNETANFEIIREIPYKELVQAGREDPLTYTAFKNAGVQLKVTPHIARDGLIKLRIMPEFGVVVSRDISGVPIIDTRRADTIALVRDGQTIAIGGLRKTQTSKDISKVPVLGDIPLIKGLFRSVTETEQVNELVVFITPRIITDPDLLAADLNEGGQNGIPEGFGGAGNRQEDPGRVIKSSQRRPEAIGSGPELTMQLAYAYLKIQRFELAKETLTSVIQRSPDNNTAYQYLGYCHLKL
ncbi:MAG: hypothetical protein KAY65_00470, partial [Planctomycetes bacterium]|nr:hypothetical protein [Planctomycetota bacterium]